MIKIHLLQSKTGTAPKFSIFKSL